MGEMPLPPYIRKRREALGESAHAPEDFERYQTVYARQAGSVAAPTAGLHFTPELLARFNHAFVTLHVGLGTFRPGEDRIHRRPRDARGGLFDPGGLRGGVREGQARRRGRHDLRAGAGSGAESAAGHGRTRIFIHPPYEFRRVDALLTNFHLPHSTLLMLVSALVGREKLLEIYREAVAQKYRFFSYGDAMLIL